MIKEKQRVETQDRVEYGLNKSSLYERDSLRLDFEKRVDRNLIYEMVMGNYEGQANSRLVNTFSACVKISR